MPSIWGLHDYSDVNRLQSWRTHELVRALGGQVWLTETGGIVKFSRRVQQRQRLRPEARGEGAEVHVRGRGLDAADQAPVHLRLDGWHRSSTRFDAGLTDAHNQPREGYVVVCKELHAAKCNVKVSSH